MTTILLRRGDAAWWTAENPVLNNGEPGFEEDTGRYKIGDGVTPWGDLEYFIPASMIPSLTHSHDDRYLTESESDARYTAQSAFDLKQGSGIGYTMTGGTTENTLASVLIPAETLGPLGQILVHTVWSMTNNANLKTMRVKLGSSVLASITATTSVSAAMISRIANRGGAASQIGMPSGSPGTGASGSAILTSTINTDADATLSITGQLAVGTDTLKLESWYCEIIPG